MTTPSTIFLASSNRNDPIDRVAKELKERYPGASLRMVLGEWWAGHRRTWPIEKSWTSVYWYQCHDLILPELMAQSQGQAQSQGHTAPIHHRMALIVAKDSSIRQMWLEILPGHGFAAIAASNTEALPEGSVDVVFFDQTDAGPDDLDTSSQTMKAFADQFDAVAALRKTYPKAKIVLCFGFPRWNEVCRGIAAGADLIVGKPFRWEGLSTMLTERYEN